FSPDVFHVAMEKGVDIVIENTRAEKVVQRIPQWHRQLVNAKSFLLLPIVLRNHTLGLLYADSDRPEGISGDAEQLGLLRHAAQSSGVGLQTVREREPGLKFPSSR